jgi:hypothetical protein
MLLLILALQSAQPDIQFEARVQARRATVQQQGEASLTVHPAPADGSGVRVQGRPERRQGSYRNIDIRLHAEASVAEPQQSARTDATNPPN